MSTTKQKRKHIKAVRPKLRLFRAKEPLLSVFMWGINHSINELSHVNCPVMLMPDDFKAHTKTRVDNHMFNKENMPSHFKFKEYCPNVFRNLRERFNVDDHTYLKSLTKDCPRDIDSNNMNKSSNSRPMVSYNGMLFIKTIQGEQVAEMHRVLKEYHQYIVETHADTLFPHYLGMYRVTINDNETYLLVCKNIFSRRFPIHKKYDLKGSTVDRQASDKEKSKGLPTFKDNDFIRDGRIIRIGAEKKEKLMNTLKSDTEFLASLNLMDYSLAVGIHDTSVHSERGDNDEYGILSSDNEQDEEEEEERGGAFEGGGGGGGVGGGGVPISAENRKSEAKKSDLGSTSSPDSITSPTLPFSPSEPPPELDPHYEPFGIKSSEDTTPGECYFLSIIDILTHYGVKKRTAQAAKTVKHGANAEISTVAPDQYARRFQEFVDKIIE